MTPDTCLCQMRSFVTDFIIAQVRASILMICDRPNCRLDGFHYPLGAKATNI